MLFGTEFGGADHPRPDRIYAADPKGDPSEKPSRRPFETVIPLADRLGLVVTQRVQAQEAKLAAEINGLADGVVVVCWEHKRIGSALLPALLGPQRPDGVPRKWQGARFDVVLRLDRAGPGPAWKFRQLCPRLLSGDSDQPM